MSTVNAKIIKAMAQFKIPYSVDFFGGNMDEYYTIVPITDMGAEFADNEPQEVICSVGIHWFLPMKKDYFSTKKKIRKALFDAGFTFPEITVDSDAETGVRHIVFECEIEDEYEFE